MAMHDKAADNFSHEFPIMDAFHRIHRGNNTMKPDDLQTIKTYLLDLQDRICDALAEADGGQGFQHLTRGLAHLALAIGPLKCLDAKRTAPSSWGELRMNMTR